MPKTERDLLGPGFEWRLHAALDRIEPRNSVPRYKQAPAVRAWRVAPLAVAAAVTGVLALTIYAAAEGSTPSEIGHRIVTAIQSNQEPSPMPPPTNPPARVSEPNHGQESAEPKQTAEPSDKPESGDSSSPPDQSLPGSTPASEPIDH